MISRIFFSYELFYSKRTEAKLNSFFDKKEENKKNQQKNDIVLPKDYYLHFWQKVHLMNCSIGIN